MSGLPRDTTLPITNTSASRATPESCDASHPSTRSMPSWPSCVDIGGYTLASQPVTVCPAAFAMAAMPPMNVPQMPRMWRCMA